MMKLTNFATILMLFFITSCTDKTPTSIAGIKLGLDVNKQVDLAKNSGLLLNDGGLTYIELQDNIRGYPEFYSMIDENNVQILHTVLMHFRKPNNVGIDNLWINNSDKQAIISLYEKKYGICKESNEIGGNQVKSIGKDISTYDWKNGLLCINLIFWKVEGSDTYNTGFVYYKFDDSYKEALERKANDQKNNSI